MPHATASSIPDWPEGRPDDTLSIWLLGDFRVSAGSHQIESGRWRLRKAATLVKLLALSETHRLHREQVLDLLWPDLEPPAAANNLHHALHRARRVLSPTDAASPHLRIQGEQVVLCPSGSLWVDVEAFEAAASAARREGDPSAYRAALALYTGDLLPADLYEDWASERRESLRSLHLALLLELAGLYEAAGAPGPAIETLQRAIAAEPACEEAHAGLMRLYAQAGQRHQALRQYDQLRQALRQELDIDPDTATQQLHADILAGRGPLAPALPGDGTGQRAAPGRRRHNLPAALTSFVGREAEIAEIKRLLGATRLLTITGMGGSGKTRLAIEAAGELVETYPDGVWLVELAPLSDGNLVQRAVAGALEVPERQDRPMLDTLVEALRPRRLLLVLDNCEHLVDACARLSQELLSGCPELQILATSREALGVLGEVTGIVPPLALPDRAQFRTVDDLLGCAAVRLFVERAQARQPSFVLMPDNARFVVTICKQVDGIPLAVELAAARVGLLSVEQIAARLENVLGLLTTGSRTAQPRQQTLRSTLDWSYDLLSEPERTLFRRVSVFAGGWTLEAAELLGAAPGMGGLDILDLLSHLVDKSLVAAEAAGGGGVRYRLLEPVRQYASERLVESGETEAVRRGHAALFLQLAQEAEPKLVGPDQAAWLERLEAEHDNLRSALRWAIAGEEAETALRLAASVWRFWFARGHLSEGRRWLERALSLPTPVDGTNSTHARAQALNAAGALAYYQCDYPRATELYETSLALRRQLGDRRGIAGSLNNLGLVAREHGDYGRAVALYEESLAIKRELGDSAAIAFSLNNLGIAAKELGDYGRAIELHEECLAIKRDLGDTEGIVISLENLGLAARDKGDLERATALHQESLGLARSLGHKRQRASSLLNLGRLACEQGRYSGALAYFEESSALARELGEQISLVECLEALAFVATASEEALFAVELLGCAAAVRASLRAPLYPNDRARYEAVLSRARQAVDADTFAAAWSRGERRAAEEAIDDALDRLAPAPAAPVDLTVGRAEAVLTRREREIARLAARGLTNRQIAAELVIAHRTVETHVGNILRKLGLNSRTELAAWDGSQP